MILHMKPLYLSAIPILLKNYRYQVLRRLDIVLDYVLALVQQVFVAPSRRSPNCIFTYHSRPVGMSPTFKPRPYT